MAARLARQGGAQLLLVHVHVPVTADPIHIEGMPVLGERGSLRREHEQAYLDRACPRLAPGVDVSAALLDGPIAGTIVTYAEKNGASLIMMTTHGRGGFERAWLGSVADEIVRVSRVPLLLLRPEPGQEPVPLRRVLVPLDGSALAEAILQPALRLARLEREAELILVTVLSMVQPPTVFGLLPDPALAAAMPARDDADQKEEQAREYLAGVAAGLSAPGVTIRTRVEVAGAIVPALLKAAQDEQADAIALATHGRSGVVRSALGSVADKLVRGSRTPVLLLRPPSPPPAR
jgi:nucleotide-binding universal stress UspA family protein